MTAKKRIPVFGFLLLFVVLALAGVLLFYLLQGKGRLSSFSEPPARNQTHSAGQGRAPKNLQAEVGQGQQPRLPSFLANATKPYNASVSRSTGPAGLSSAANGSPSFSAHATLPPYLGGAQNATGGSTVNGTGAERTPSFLPRSNSTAVAPSAPHDSNDVTAGILHNATASSFSSRNATNGAQGEDIPALVFSKGKPLDKRGNVVGGPAVTAVSRTGGASRMDSVITRLFITSLGEALASSYWPQGTHPAAAYKGVCTFSLKWANAYYGTKLTGFGVDKADPVRARHRVLQYALMASMVEPLYHTYLDTFLDAVESRALKLQRGKEARHLTSGEMAEMYALFSSRAKALSGALKAYIKVGDISARLVSLREAEDAVLDANYKVIEASDGPAGEVTPEASLTRALQQAVMNRERVYSGIATAMRSAGDTRGMDADTLVFIASWLHRRGPEAMPAVERFAACLENLADAFEAAEVRCQQSAEGEH